MNLSEEKQYTKRIIDVLVSELKIQSTECDVGFVDNYHHTIEKIKNARDVGYISISEHNHYDSIVYNLHSKFISGCMCKPKT